MEQYISKAAVVAEIKNRIKKIPKDETDEKFKAIYGNEAFVLTNLLSFLDTLEVKEEPVSVWHNMDEVPIKGEVIVVQTKDTFYGLSVQKGGSTYKNRNKDRYVRWAYASDLLNLSNVQRTVKNEKEDVVSTDTPSPNSLKISRNGDSRIEAMTETLRKKEIDEAANEYIDGEPDDAQKVVSKVGFLFGAEWADEHPRVHHQLPARNVWHDSNIEQPQLGSDIVVLQGKSGEVLNSTISVEPDRLWAYINDLLDLTKREEAMKEALRMEYEKGRADVLRCIDPDEMVADFCSRPLSKTRSLASIYRQGIIDMIKRINNNEKTSITSTRSIDDGGV